MKQRLALTSVVVRDYDEAIAFYVTVLGFVLVEDTYIASQDKRWVVVAPSGDGTSRVLLARAIGDEQASRIGNQTGGRVFLFLHTDDFWRDYRAYLERGVEFVRLPKVEPYGTVAVFRDLYGNLWDLVQPSTKHESRVEGTTDASSFKPAGWPAIVPRLVAHDAAGLVEFIRRTFEATGAYRELAPTELTIGDAVLMVSTAGERNASTAFLYVYVRDTDAVYRRAIEQGARSVETPAEMPYGDRRAMVEDRWGNTWQIATHRGFGGAS